MEGTGSHQGFQGSPRWGEEDQLGPCGSCEVETSQLGIFFAEAHKVPVEVEKHHSSGDEIVFSGELSPPEAEQAVSTGERRAEVLKSRRSSSPILPSIFWAGLLWVEKMVEIWVGVLLPQSPVEKGGSV